MVGIPAVGSGRISGTDLAVITLIPLAAFELVVGLPVATQSLQRVRQAAARMFAVTDSTDPGARARDSGAAARTAPDLQLRSVWAGYPGRRRRCLRDVDVSLPPGRRLAVIGPSGSGKSTLAAVLLRFLPTAAGSSSLGGDALDRSSGDALRTVVGLVGQDAYLFDGTVADNLRIGRRDATEAELGAVLGRVGLAAWLAELPRGVDTDVGRRGRPPVGWPAPADRRGPGPVGRLSGAGARRAGRTPRAGGGRRPGGRRAGRHRWTHVGPHHAPHGRLGGDG